jgi:hypothetical protein
MNTFLHVLQLTILSALVCSALLLLAAFFAGFIAPFDVWVILKWLRPVLFALGLALIALARTSEIEDPRAAARFNSLVLGPVCGLLTIWAYRANQQVRGKMIRRVSGAAWALIVATGLVTVIESTNLILWSAAEPVALGVIWLDIILILQVTVLALAFTRERSIVFRVQPDSAAYHPHGSSNAYPDAGYYGVRVAPGKPDPRRHPHPRGDRRSIANPVAWSHTDSRQGNRPAHAPRKP